jgi:hypothetical protein
MQQSTENGANSPSSPDAQESAAEHMTSRPQTLSRNQRLDRLPINRAHKKLLVASGIGWAFDAMDVGLGLIRGGRHSRRPALSAHPQRTFLGAVHRIRRHGDWCRSGEVSSPTA